MTPDQIQLAAETLWNAWMGERYLDAIPESCRPQTREQGYAIQQRIAERSGQATVGWKIAATSQAGQKHLRVDGPLAGRLLESRVHRNESPVPMGKNRMRVAEAEFAFRLGRDLLPRPTPFTDDEVLAAIESLHPAIEIPDSRYLDYCVVGSPQLIADNACAHHFVLGDATTADWRGLDLSAHVVHARLDQQSPREGLGANVLGDPRRAMTWIANELRSHGITLRAGQVVTTGTAIVPLPIDQGNHIEADFGCLGAVTTRMI